MSGTLKKLRFKYDEVHKMVAQKEAELEKIRKTLEQVQTQEVLEEGDQMKSSENLENLSRSSSTQSTSTRSSRCNKRRTSTCWDA